MVIVCFSYNSLPQNDAEAFCTARFLSAIAAAGVKVELLTIDHRAEVDESVCHELLHPDIGIHRIALEPASVRSLGDAWSYRYLTNLPIRIEEMVSQVRSHLASHSVKPVLVTRASPTISSVVGFHARDLASLWVAHFSDPSPGVGAYSGRTRYLELMESWWAKRILRSADMVSVTSRNSARWFRDRHKLLAASDFHVAYHVGNPSLDVADKLKHLDVSKVNFAHVGFWGKRRFMPEVIREFDAAHRVDPRIALYQFGPVDPGTIDELADLDWLTIDPGLASPRMSTAVLHAQSINVVIDQNDNLSYCPYLPSKFAYAVASGRPLLAVGQIDSEMGKLFKEYGSFYFANIENPNSLRDTLLAICSTSFERLSTPNNGLARLFDSNAVASKFLNALSVRLAARKANCG